jgi:hypothetical protein
MKLARIAMSSLMISAFDPLTAAHAQTKPKLAILIDELRENDLKCGMRKETIKTSANLVLRQNDIDVSTEISVPYLWIMADALPNSDTVCTYHLSISIGLHDEWKKRDGFRSKYESVSLCRKDTLVRTLKSDMEKSLSDQTEILLKSCLAQVEY